MLSVYYMYKFSLTFFSVISVDLNYYSSYLFPVTLGSSNFHSCFLGLALSLLFAYSTILCQELTFKSAFRMNAIKIWF